jgi:hypothetical protein
MKPKPKSNELLRGIEHEFLSRRSELHRICLSMSTEAAAARDHYLGSIQRSMRHKGTTLTWLANLS